MTSVRLRAAELLTFTVDQSYDLGAPAEAVFAALTSDIGEWWGQPYLRAGAQDIRLDLVAGGRLYQPLAGGGVFVMATVQEIAPNRKLSLRGVFGIPGAVFGEVRYTLEPLDDKHTRLGLEHHVIGDLSPEMETAFVEGWPRLIDAGLRAFVERGESRGVRAR